MLKNNFLTTVPSTYDSFKTSTGLEWISNSPYFSTGLISRFVWGPFGYTFLGRAAKASKYRFLYFLTTGPTNNPAGNHLVCLTVFFFIVSFYRYRLKKLLRFFICFFFFFWIIYFLLLLLRGPLFFFWLYFIFHLYSKEFSQIYRDLT